MKLAACGFTLGIVANCLGAIHPNALSVSVMQEQQIDTSRSGTTRQMDTSVRSLSQTRILNLTLQNIGANKEEPLTLKWVFIFKDIDRGRFGYHSGGSLIATLPKAGKLALKITSNSIDRNQTTERGYHYSSQYVTGKTPWGWVITFFQGDKMLKQEASDSGILEWSIRNPPPQQGRQSQ